MTMSRFELSLIATLLASALWLAQLAVSFAVIRSGCVILLVGYFLALACDAFMDRSKARAEDIDADLITIIAPHIKYAIFLLFAVLTGVYIGW